MIRVSVIFIFFLSIACINPVPVSAQMGRFGAGGPKKGSKPAGKKIINKITLYNSSEYDDKKSAQLITHEKLKREVIEAVKYDIMSFYRRECPAQASIDSQDYSTLISTLINNKEGSSTWDDGVLEYRLAFGISISYYAKILCAVSNDSKLLTIIKKGQKRADDAFDTIRQLQNNPYSKSKQDEYDRAVNVVKATNYFKEGILSEILKDSEEALEAYEDALDLYPGFSEVYFQRAELYHAMSKKEEAVNDYKQAARLGNEKAKNFLESKNISWE